MTIQQQEVILGLGSNVGERANYVKKALNLITERQILENIEISKIYESKAFLPDDAPPDWDKNFINLAIVGFCSLSPKQLLFSIKQIEQELGRIDRGFWSPREIDIDILTYGTNQITTEDLVIPHQSFLERPFALLPAHDLRPEWKYPKKSVFYNKTLQDIVKNINIDESECWQIEIN